MLDLFQIDATIHGLWHAGSYDPHDFLGRLIGDKPWVRHTELALFDAIDKNCFASNFHIELFVNTMFPGNNDPEYLNSKIVSTGWPMEYLGNYIQPQRLVKEDIILFKETYSSVLIAKQSILKASFFKMHNQLKQCLSRL